MAQVSTRPAPRLLAGYALGVAGVIIFSATLPFTRMALEGLARPPSPSVALVAAIAAGLTLYALGKRFPRAQLVQLAAAGLMLVYGFPGFSSIAMQTVPASHGGILPLLTAAFAARIGGKKPGIAFWAWSVAGAAPVLTFSLSGAEIAPGIGDFWLLLAALSASCGSCVAFAVWCGRQGADRLRQAVA